MTYGRNRFIASLKDAWMGEEVMRPATDRLAGLDPFMLAAAEIAVDANHSVACHHLREIAERAGSPIEQLFGAAFYAASCASDWDVEVGRIHIGRGFRHRTKLHIDPQARVGDYRVDFLVSYVERALEDAPRFTLVIECDGHAFHEKTKEQAASDKERDRVLQSHGHRVFRFTGSEIHADPFRCAKQCIDAMYELAQKAPVP